MMKIDAGDNRHPDKILKCRPEIAYPLYIEGSLIPEDAGGVAIVGSRKPSLYGIKMAQAVAQKAVMNSKTVISGLARGIDTESHRSALKYGGRTIAVLGTGIDVIYPEENIGLAEEIRQNCALISQFPPQTPPLKKNFPIRNEIVAKMCSVLVLVQASTKSGSLITARLAREFDKKVFVIPGPIDDELFTGNYQFLNSRKKDPGVELLYDLEQLDEFFNCKNFFSEHIKPLNVLTDTDLEDDEKKVYRLIVESGEGIDFDTLSERSGFSATELPSILLFLMMKEMIDELPGKIYRYSEVKL
ncbi:MAG TPA: DNA-protecting protein DprA [bacterium]|jgi:DNA processing protein|nr:DNA-processing protein DprA [bacterium]MDX9806728.1 DNA-protecting protein DprA [bacterium]HPM46861.1 DNA-protecting protein DprA [bacterium]HPV20691.1 DNA-protecting protein DprA [bacterium]HPY13733.1 DNA-protecting protein DprA [bacterium]